MLQFKPFQIQFVKYLPNTSAYVTEDKKLVVTGFFTGRPFSHTVNLDTLDSSQFFNELITVPTTYHNYTFNVTATYLVIDLLTNTITNVNNVSSYNAPHYLIFKLYLNRAMNPELEKISLKEVLEEVSYYARNAGDEEALAFSFIFFE